ncbi:MAG: glycosyltransferase [Ferruginibacter sp.]
MIGIPIFSLLLLVIYTFLFLYYRIGWKKIPDHNKIPGSQPAVFISVIIPARNEEMNLPGLLNSLLNQTYSSEFFEVIIVDDHSTDNSSNIVNNFRGLNSRCIQLSDHVTSEINSYKKKAIEIGIRESKGELIVTTDADCSVLAPWLQNIADFYTKNQSAFIVMPVSIYCNNNLFQVFQSLDFMALQGITGASVQMKLHSMCNGANLAYTRKAFDDVNGFSGIDSIASGDDMLLMHKIYKHAPGKVHFLKSTEVIVATEPAYTLQDFLNQRIRWASKADKYDDKSILPVLGLVYLFNLVLLVLPVIAIFKNGQMIFLGNSFSFFSLWLFLMACKIIVELIFLYPIAVFFNKKKLLFIFPFLQPFHILYTVIAGWMGKFGTYEWKGRKVK